MAKPANRSHSRRALEFLKEVGAQIREARVDRNMTAQELAERAGISRALLYRVEHGDPSCSVGAVLEAAAIVGAPFMDLDDLRPMTSLEGAPPRARKLRRAVRPKAKAVNDAF